MTAELSGVSRATLSACYVGPAGPVTRNVPIATYPVSCRRGRSLVVRGNSPIKSRTTNRQGRHLSTRHIPEIVTEHGVETPDRGLIKLAPGRLKASTLNRHMQRLSFDLAG